MYTYIFKENAIAPLLSFLVPRNTLTESDLPIKINAVNSIHVEHNLVIETYSDNKQMHTIHELSPDVSLGYKRNEVLKNIIYLSVITETISSAVIRRVDQDGRFIDFCDELITIRLHLRPSSSSHQ